MMACVQKVIIKASPKKVFEAIAQSVQHWWGKIDSPTSKIGDEFTVTFDQTYWKFRTTTFNPFHKIVWQCVDARHVHKGYKNIEKEWLETSIDWHIEAVNSESMLTFHHHGLIPTLSCYELCAPAWEKLVTKSLKHFVETGKGMPLYPDAT